MENTRLQSSGKKTTGEISEEIEGPTHVELGSNRLPGLNVVDEDDDILHKGRAIQIGLQSDKLESSLFLIS
jgi:hypothetical protein